MKISISLVNGVNYKKVVITLSNNSCMILKKGDLYGGIHFLGHTHTAIVLYHD